MATTQKKKSSGSRSASGGKRAASAKPKSGASTRRTAPPPAQTPKPFRREVGAVVCLLLAVFTFLGYFRIEAVFIDLFSNLLRGLLGYGFWLMPPALLMGAYILAFHRGRPVCLRLTCALLLPLTVSVFLHGLLAPRLAWDGELLKTLWGNGGAMKSGGVLGGVLAQLFVQLFSKVGCTLICILSGFLLALAACDRTLMDAADWIFNRPEYEYEPEPEPVRRSRRESVPERAAVSRRASAIDIPVDDGPLADRQPEAAEPPQKKGFFNKKPRVPSPDQLLTRGSGRTEDPEEREAPQGGEERETPPFVSEPIVLHKPAPVAPESEVSAPETGEEPESGPVQEIEWSPIVAAPPKPAPAPVPTKPSPPPGPAEKLQQETREMDQVLQDALAQEPAPYQYPPLSLLREGPGDIGGEALAELNANRQRLSDTIHSFGIDANIINVVRGPSVTRYELELDQGVRLNKLTNLSDDIALALGATGVRIAPIPDKISIVGIEVPNKLVSPVNIHSVIGSKNFTDSKSKVSFAVGKDISGNPIVGDINELPHLLIAGTTGSGKSVCTNSIITSLLYKATPDEVRLIMVDPKMVELGIYNGIPHLLIPVVTDPKKAAGALQWAVTEMMKRYRIFSEVGVRKLEEYNALAVRTEGMEKMPFIVVLIDELADLMLVAAKEVEESICRVAQMGRAAGMHLVIATQRPSADVITGLMKANIPSRIAFAVASSLESRIILDNTGAEKLVGRGDMLYSLHGSGKPVRVQGCFISDQEVSAVVNFIKQNSGSPQYDDAVIHEIERNAAEKEKGNKGGTSSSAPDEPDGGGFDELINAAAEVVMETGQASVSMLQRRLKLGYARAARLMDQLEEMGIVGPFEGSKPRQIMITKEQWLEKKYRQGIVSAPPQDAAPVPEASGSEDGLDRSDEDTL